MATERMNLISMMNQAWQRKNEVSAEEFEIKVKNLISHAFVEIERMYVDFCKSKGYEYKDDVFYIFQRLIIYFIFTDGDFLQGEYDAYVKYCNWAKIEPLTVDDCKNLYNRLSTEDIVNDIKLINGIRDSIDPVNFTALVQGFCYMSLLGDKSFDENEYYILRCFFQDGYDYCPADWETFKREWK